MTIRCRGCFREFRFIVVMRRYVAVIRDSCACAARELRRELSAAMSRKSIFSRLRSAWTRIHLRDSPLPSLPYPFVYNEKIQKLHESGEFDIRMSRDEEEPLLPPPSFRRTENHNNVKMTSQ